MLNYIFYLFLFMGTNLLAMESGIQQGHKFLKSEDGISLVVELPDEIKLNIFKMIATPTDPLKPDQIARAKKDVQSLRLVCKNFDALFKDAEFQKLDDQIYEIETASKFCGQVANDQVLKILEASLESVSLSMPGVSQENIETVKKLLKNELNKKQHEQYLKAAIANDIVPYVAYYLSKNNRSKNWSDIMSMAAQRDESFMKKFLTPNFAIMFNRNKESVRQIFQHNKHSNLIDWLEQNRVEEKVQSGSGVSNTVPLFEVGDTLTGFFDALEKLHE